MPHHVGVRLMGAAQDEPTPGHDERTGVTLPRLAAATGLQPRPPTAHRGRTDRPPTPARPVSRSLPPAPQRLGQHHLPAYRQRSACPAAEVTETVESDVDDLAAAIEAIRRHMVAQVSRAALLVLGQGRGTQRIVATTHAALGTGLTVLLNCHGYHSKVNLIQRSGLAFELP